MSPPRFKHVDIRISVTIKASADEAYGCLTSARQLCSWWLVRAETEARNAGRLRMVWPAEAANPVREARGRFVDLDAGRKAAWLWDSDRLPAGVPPLITFFLEPRGRGQCEVTLLHAGFSATPSQRKRLADWRRHWEDCLAKLALYLESGKTCKANRLSLAELAMLKKADGGVKGRAKAAL